ncbi:peptide chain release factor N(5)-glutamine methyltransferase [Pelagerythrobacter rhizovicinus]|uniref:Release factor glutamine methyltransferase n=1 Tax=Pelagerythrobacter rhizovicinus TaxID=2268576 RepID=A0A4Q2KIC4_9SPHN|nr:peptide chain release factor N(5)-glutamine methyltransferase [Pelagerythrobacter rhizovicinus]RXZ64928.1 peptide chain release factor N(5)-glutamine methyltransferase [Pelagerythrobacter rhizovicinus]
MAEDHATVAGALRAAAERLEVTSDTARLDAEVLMAHALGVSRSELLLRHMRDAAPKGFAALLERRAAHEPVAYIVGEQEFYGRSFRVTPDVLIPRADSEATLAAALEGAGARGRVLDLGVGSGALLLSFLAERPGWQGVGIDRSPGALAVARDNAARLDVERRARLLPRDWHVPGWGENLGQFDRVIANPPYVEDAATIAPSVRRYEPAGALFAGPEGLDDYRALIPQLPALLAPAGLAVLEIGAAQADAVSAIARQAGFSAELRRDLADRPRALILRKGVGKGHCDS